MPEWEGGGAFAHLKERAFFPGSSKGAHPPHRGGGKDIPDTHLGKVRCEAVCRDGDGVAEKWSRGRRPRRGDKKTSLVTAQT